jgi:multicomponent Na+:H+ antiporter subunit E
MKEPERKAPPEGVHSVRSFFYLLTLLLLIWLALTSSFNRQELAAGAAISLALAGLLFRWYRGLELPPPTPARIAWFGLYLGVLACEIVKANFDVAYRVLHPKLPIKPGIVVIKTGLKQDLAKMILANSITLTPGTFTLDIVRDNLLIHWINVRTDEADEATRIIGDKFEKYLRRIFQ